MNRRQLAGRELRRCNGIRLPLSPSDCVSAALAVLKSRDGTATSGMPSGYASLGPMVDSRTD
jgi:hypothetical protein